MSRRNPRRPRSSTVSTTKSRETSDGSACLARRLSERGVRFVQCSHSYKWDQHVELVKLHTKNAAEVDKPIAGLLKDMKARGLFKDTLVIWGGEFGRTPWAQGADGRDHNPYGYTIWMAGAGVKPGFIYGATDEFGYHAVENRMHIHDLHATVLHMLGLQHDKLTYRYAGRNFRLTDVAGTVHNGIYRMRRDSPLIALLAVIAACAQTPDDGVLRKADPTSVRLEMLRLPRREGADGRPESFLCRRSHPRFRIRSHHQERPGEEPPVSRALCYTEAVKMPPTGKLGAEEIAAVRTWIESGAPLPPAAVNRSAKAAAHLARKIAIIGHSSPIQARRASRVRTASWANPIDQFILAKLEEKGIQPAPPASKLTLAAARNLRSHRPAANQGGDQRRSWTTSRPTPSRRWSIGCSHRRNMASDGAATGSMSRATPTRPAWTKTTSIRMPGAIATTSSKRSTRTRRSMTSSSSNSPAICCPRRRRRTGTQRRCDRIPGHRSEAACAAGSPADDL